VKELEFNKAVMPLVDKVNFSGILLTPKKIYYEWSRYMLPEMDYYNEPETEFFLLPQFDSPEETEEFCRLFFDLFFQYKLRKCSDDAAFWPVNRTYEMFQQWFDLRITSNVSSLK
jgi:hypothetical protein